MKREFTMKNATLLREVTMGSYEKRHSKPRISPHKKNAGGETDPDRKTSWARWIQDAFRYFPWKASTENINCVLFLWSKRVEIRHRIPRAKCTCRRAGGSAPDPTGNAPTRVGPAIHPPFSIAALDECICIFVKSYPVTFFGKEISSEGKKREAQ